LKSGGEFYIGQKICAIVRKVDERIKDLADCLIVATAVVYSDIMLTETKDIPKLIDFKVLDFKRVC